ncbi:hypothetical protein ES703_89947 [subsurface metagenome]
MTESSFLKSHKQFVKRHLNRRPFKPVPSKYPCAHRIKSRNSREHFSGPGLADNFITLDQVMIEVLSVIPDRIKKPKRELTDHKSLKWIKGGWR